MRIEEALANTTKFFLDSAPVIYYFEQNPKYFNVVSDVFIKINRDVLAGVTSSVTLAECLIQPLRANSQQLVQKFTDFIVGANNITFSPIDRYCAELAAEFRARYNLSLADAFQLAVALSTGCEALLTNDTVFRRVTELQVIILDDFLNP